MATELRNYCHRCLREYDVNERREDGKPAHPHHCNDCCKKCERCGKWYEIMQFHPNRESEEFLEWIGRRGLHGEDPTGLLMGRHLFGDVCMTCQPFVVLASTEPEPESELEPEMEEAVEVLSGIERLNRILEEQKRKQQ